MVLRQLRPHRHADFELFNYYRCMVTLAIVS
jgi:hypothetical protein